LAEHREKVRFIFEIVLICHFVLLQSFFFSFKLVFKTSEGKKNTFLRGIGCLCCVHLLNECYCPFLASFNSLFLSLSLFHFSFVLFFFSTLKYASRDFIQQRPRYLLFYVFWCIIIQRTSSEYLNEFDLISIQFVLCFFQIFIYKLDYINYQKNISFVSLKVLP